MAVGGRLPVWSVAAPLVGWGVYIAYAASGTTAAQVALVGALFACVLAAVHHAELIAHRVGEPFGTFLFAVAVTVIEVGLIVSIMLAAGPGAETLARDTVLSAIMIILNGVIGLCLFVGGLRHGEQTYAQTGVSAALAALAALSVLTLILPNHVTSVPGPIYAPPQLAFVGAVSLIVYGAFVLVQTVKHRDYFLPEDVEPRSQTAQTPESTYIPIKSGVLLVLCLMAVVWFAKTLAPAIETAVAEAGAPKALVGVAIAGIVLLPEGMAALRAASANRLQTSLNLALGSALATIGLTIPVIAALALFFDWRIHLGVDAKNTVLLILTLMVATLSLSTGRTTMMQGALHLTLFTVFVFMIIVP